MKLVLLEFSDSFDDISYKRSLVSISEPLFMEFKSGLLLFLLLVTLFFYYLTIFDILDGNIRLRLFTMNVAIGLEAERIRI
jgi:hypothetical protein